MFLHQSFTTGLQKYEVVLLWNIEPNLHHRLCQGLFGVDDPVEILRSSDVRFGVQTNTTFVEKSGRTPTFIRFINFDG